VADGIAIKLKKAAVRKYWEWWEKIKKRQKLIVTVFSKRLGSGGWWQWAYYSLCQLREGNQSV
jgi:hypothetical protein